MQYLIKILSLHSWWLQCFAPATAPHRRPGYGYWSRPVRATVSTNGLAWARARHRASIAREWGMVGALRRFTVLYLFSS